ncbi:MAG: TonB-dependent receptor, partial [Woeseiaceae bacterium]|nr:TonB-dependent receptor [Woeseiaceae bacterium]
GYLAERLAKNSPPVKRVDDYWSFDAMVEYRLTENTLIKLNVTNITDEYYIDQLHPWHVVPGPGTTTVLALNTVF